MVIYQEKYDFSAILRILVIKKFEISIGIKIKLNAWNKKLF